MDEVFRTELLASLLLYFWLGFRRYRWPDRMYQPSIFLSRKYSRTNQKPADSRRTSYDFPVVDKERTWRILEEMAPIAKAHECLDSPRD